MDPQKKFESILSLFISLRTWGDFFFKLDDLLGETFRHIFAHILFKSEAQAESSSEGVISMIPHFLSKLS